MIIASNQVTVYALSGVKNITTYYQRRLSIDDPPLLPTSNPPAEPWDTVVTSDTSGSASGAAIRVNDSADGKLMNVELSSKNLFKIGTTSDYTLNSSGCTVSGDTLVGKSVSSASNFVINKNTAYSAGKYALSQTVSAETASAKISRFFIKLYDNDDNLISTPNLLQGFTYNAVMRGYIKTTTSSSGILKDTVTVEIPDSVAYWKRGFSFYVYPHVDNTLVTISNIQTELGDKATDYTSYVSDFSESKVYRYRKNLFDMRLLDPIGYSDLGSYKLTVDEVLENGYIVQGKKGETIGNSRWSNGWFNPGGQYALKKKWGCYVPAGVTITWSYDVTLLEKPYYPDDDYPYTFRTVNRTVDKTSKPTNENIRLTLNEKKHITVTGVNPISGILTPQFTLNSNKLKIENIQLEIGDTDTGYVPFHNGENLFDIDSITGCYNRLTGTVDPAGGTKEEGYLKATLGAYSRSYMWGPSTMHLKKGIYTISADHYYAAVEGETIYSVYMGVATTAQNITASVSVSDQYITKTDTWTYVSASIEVPEDGDYYLRLQPVGSKTAYVNLDVRFKNIQVKYSATKYTANTDGKVENVTSNYPITTLLPGAGDVVIDADYTKTNDRTIYSTNLIEFTDGSYSYTDISTDYMYELMKKTTADYDNLSVLLKDSTAIINQDIDSITQSVHTVEKRIDDSVDDLNSRIVELDKKVDLRLTEDKVDIRIEEKLQNGVSSVYTETGFKFDKDGLNVSKSGTPINTQITENGMVIKNNDTHTDMLTANKDGVDATNLSATTFLKIGGRSRFQNYETDTDSNRTGCFWIGG